MCEFPLNPEVCERKNKEKLKKTKLSNRVPINVLVHPNNTKVDLICLPNKVGAAIKVFNK